ncbi:MAG TPA: hypothetical protein PKC19_01750 [Roseiflexaceae bacterium]|nr:hypothetical protein [Roseiflexaceae bacterium]
MQRQIPRICLLCLFIVVIGLLPTTPPAAAAGTYRSFLPILQNRSAIVRIGVDLRSSVSSAAIPYVVPLRSSWARAGDILWSQFEPFRGAGFRWQAMPAVDANIRRLRAIGVEPILIIQQSPAWAQSLPNSLCSPVDGTVLHEFVRFVEAVVTRYSDGPLRVDYWQIWNEVDYNPKQVKADAGVGCWANDIPPYYGGDYYGLVLQQVAPAIRSANPHAVILAAGFAHFWPDETVTRGFLRGMLKQGAGSSFDVLSYHAYGTWGALDRLVLKTVSMRQGLAEFGLQAKPLFADEIGATCYDALTCPPDFAQFQSNYAARIYGIALSLNLMGSAWYTMVSPPPGFLESQLIDEIQGQLKPRPAYTALRRSIDLLYGAAYIGPPITSQPPQRPNTIHMLTFRKGINTLYLLWVPEARGSHIQRLTVPRWAQATCTTHLERDPVQSVDCSDSDGDGIILVTVDGSPHYVEVSP